MPRRSDDPVPADLEEEDPPRSLADRLIGRYALEADVYHTLLEVARQQGELLAAAQRPTSHVLEQCAELFARKDELLQTLAHLEREAAPLKRRWTRQDASDDDTRRLNGLLDRILATLDALIDQEERNEARLIRARDQLDARPAAPENDAADEPAPALSEAPLAERS